MDTVKFIILLLYLVVVVFVVAFNWLYSVRTIRATRQIGLYVPAYIRRLVKVSSVLAVLTGVLALMFLFTGMY
jgi:hypothetical protein